MGNYELLKLSTMMAVFSAVGVLPFAASSEPDRSLEYARRLCGIVDDTGAASGKCSVSGWGHSVDISMAVSAADARTFCARMADMLPTKGIKFAPGWQINIYSPYSGEKTIAFCMLK